MMMFDGLFFTCPSVANETQSQYMFAGEFGLIRSRGAEDIETQFQLQPLFSKIIIFLLGKKRG